MRSHFSKPIQIGFYSVPVLLLGSLGLVVSVNAQAADCPTVSAGANITISVDCISLVLDGAGTVGINSGVTVDGAGQRAVAVQTSGTTGTLTNNGAITATSSDVEFSSAFGIFKSGPIGTLTNNGSITINNTGGGPDNEAHGIFNYLSPIDTLTNNGSITVTNTGNGAAFANGITTYGNITTLTNNGSITANATVDGSAFGIVNGGYTLTTLNNTQGGNGSSAATTALTYANYLPTNYNIGIVSATHYGQLWITGPDNRNSRIDTFGIYGSPAITARTYAGVLTNNVTPTSVQTEYDNMILALVSNGSVYDLTFTGISLAQTQASIATSANRLRSVFNQSIVSSNFANMNTYDCNLFDTNGMCIAAGGRYTDIDSPNFNSTSAVVVLGYKATPNIRIGGFLDQNINNNTPTGIKISNKNPLMGVFAIWNQNEDYLGYQVKIANAYQDKDVTTTRDAVAVSEAGSGTTNLNSQSYVAELSYAFKATEKTILRPYLTLRHTTIKQDAYTETGVTTPLSYASLQDRSTTALVGLKLNHALTPKTTLTASLGIEQDLEHSVDQYSATSSSIANLTSENFNDNIKRTRRVASAGAYYAVSKTQRISGDVYYQQLPFQSTGSTTAYVSYMIGL